MCTECLVVFPDGVGIIPWLVPGTNEIGVATAENERISFSFMAATWYLWCWP